MSITIQHYPQGDAHRCSLPRHHSISSGFTGWMMDWDRLVWELLGGLWLMDMISTWHASLIWANLDHYSLVDK